MVIGSGAGGATVAAELAEAGFDVVVLEEGSYYQTARLHRRHLGDGAPALPRRRRDDGASATRRSCSRRAARVGGSTVINGGMSWRTPEKHPRALAARGRPRRVRAKRLEPYFERVEKRIHVAPPWTPRRSASDNELLKQGADAKGWKIIGNLRNQAHCVGTQQLRVRLPDRRQADRARQLHPARAALRRARLRRRASVDRITRHGKRATGVTGHVRARRRHARAASSRCARSSSSPRAARSTRPRCSSRSGFRSPSGQIGRNLSLHPNVKVVAIFDEDVTGWKGAHQAFQVREFQDEGFLVRRGQPAAERPRDVVPASRPRARRADAAATTAWCSPACSSRTPPPAACARSPAAARRRSISSPTPTPANLQRGVSLLSELLFAAGAKRILLPFHGAPELHGPDEARRLLDAQIPERSWEVVTVHMMGTARDGRRPHAPRSPMRSAWSTTPIGLIVADASLFPTPIGVNPMETIMALATRNAERILSTQAQNPESRMREERRKEGAPSRATCASARAPCATWRRCSCAARPPTPRDGRLGYRGLNTPPFARFLGIKKFIKGFYKDDAGRFGGYNVVAAQHVNLATPWAYRGGRPRRFGFYKVAPVDPESRDNAYLHALLLDYSRGGNAVYDPSNVIRDYVVRVDRGSDDLLLGKAYVAAGPVRLPVSYFLLERHQKTDFRR